jgi:hypothetical protein
MKDEDGLACTGMERCYCGFKITDVFINYLKRQPSDVRNIKYSYGTFMLLLSSSLQERNSGLLWTERL